MTGWQNTIRLMFPPGRGRLQLAGLLLAFAFPVLALVLDKAASTIFAIFFLAGLWLLGSRRFERPDPAMRWVLIAFAAYFLVGTLSFFLGEQTRLGEKLLGRDIRFLGAVPVFFVIHALRPSRTLVVAGIGIGGVIAGLVALGQVALHPDAGARAGGETISIVFGHLCAALAAASLAVAFRGENTHRWMAMSGAVGAVLGVVLSGTRGAALSLLVVGCVLVAHWCGPSVRRGLIVVGGVVASAAVVLLTPFGDNLETRFAEGMTGIARHLDARAFQEDFDGPERVPACLDSPERLHWMVASGATRTFGNSKVEVLANDSAFSSVAGVECAGDAFLRIRNPGPGRATVFLPYRNVSPTLTDGGMLLVRGEGAVRFVGDGGYRKTVATAVPQALALERPPNAQPRHAVVIEPGAYMDVLPVVTVPGEYRYMGSVGSISERTYMWQAAYEMFLRRPVLGGGAGSFPAFLEKRAAGGQGPWQITRYDHAHNEILTVAAERGVFGLLTLFAVYAAPLMLFLRRRDALATAGIAFVASIFLSGLTETIFNHSLGITYYCTLVLLLAAASKQPADAGFKPPGKSPGQS